MAYKPKNLKEDKLIITNPSPDGHISGITLSNPFNSLPEFTKNQGLDFFDSIQYRKKGERIKPIQTKKLKAYSELCDNNILYRCDYMSLSIYDVENMRKAPLFNWRQDTDDPWRNDSNSNLKNIPFFGYDSEGTGNATIESIGLEDFGNYAVQYSRASGQDIYIVSVVWRDTPVPIMRISLYDHGSAFQKLNKMEGRVDFYGEFFRLQEITASMFSISYVLAYLLGDYAKPVMHKSYITRYDYKIDFFAPKDDKGLQAKEIFQVTRATEGYKSFTFKRQKQPYGIISKDGKETYTGRKTVSLTKGKSKWINSRFYHKKADIWAKGKEFLYHDYMSYEGEIWRYETEFNSQFCTGQKISLWQELEQGQMSDRVLQYLGVAPKTASFSRQYLLQEVAFDRLTNENKNRYYRKLIKAFVHFAHTGGNIDEFLEDANKSLQVVKQSEILFQHIRSGDPGGLKELLN